MQMNTDKNKLFLHLHLCASDFHLWLTCTFSAISTCSAVKSHLSEHQHHAGFFEQGFQCAQEFRRGRAINHAVIGRQR